MTRISVFGGSQTKPGEPAYQQALHLGNLLGQAGFTVLTGGYIGTMEAVSRGVAQAGGTVIGVTCDEIERWRPVKPNPWVQEELRFPKLRQRLFALIDECEGALVLPGGIGTLAEMAEMWSHLQIRAIGSKPLIAIGPGWNAVFEQFFAAFNGYIPQTSRQRLVVMPDVDAAFNELNRQLSENSKTTGTKETPHG